MSENHLTLKSALEKLRAGNPALYACARIKMEWIKNGAHKKCELILFDEVKNELVKVEAENWEEAFVLLELEIERITDNRENI